MELASAWSVQTFEGLDTNRYGERRLFKFVLSPLLVWMTGCGGNFLFLGRPNLFCEEPRGPYYAPLMPGAMKGANENLNCDGPRVWDSGASQAP